MKNTRDLSIPIEVLPEPEPTGLRGQLASWDRFWFRPADPLPLGAIRILTGLVLIYVHLTYTPNLYALFGPSAWMDDKPVDFVRHAFTYYEPQYSWDPSTKPYDTGWPIWSVFFHVKSYFWLGVVHASFLLAMLAFTLGIATRVTSVIVWFAVINYIDRSVITVFGMDTITTILTFYLMMAPCGATLSVDRWLSKRQARRRGQEPEAIKPMVSANLVLRLMQVHFCIIYLAAGLSKLQGTSWWNGTAIWGTMANYSFAPMDWPAYVGMLQWLAERRWLWEMVMIGFTYGTLALEISFAFLVWQPKLRWLMIIGAVMLHTGIGLIMGLSTFSLAMLCLLASFIPATTFHRLLAALGPPQPQRSVLLPSGALRKEATVAS